MDSYINSDLIRGNIDTIILRALVESDKYGYEILKEIEAKSQGEYILKQPTLYSCLKRLELQGYITSFWGQITLGGRRKYYKLTPKGKEYFDKIQADWEYSRTLIDKLIAKRRADAQNLEINDNGRQDFDKQIQNLNKDNNIVSSAQFQSQNQTTSFKIDNHENIVTKENSIISADVKISNENQDNLVKKTEQIFILGKNDMQDDKNETKEVKEDPEKVIPIYTPIKGSPIYAKSDRTLSSEAAPISGPSSDNFRSFIKNEQNTDSKIPKQDKFVSKPVFQDEPSYYQKPDIKPLNEEKLKAKIDDNLIGKTKINYDTNEVFFANQIKSVNSEPLKTYEDLMLQEKMELFKNNISQKANRNKTYSLSLDNKLYSMPNNQMPEFIDNVTPSSDRTYESIEEAKQEYKIEKEYKNVLGKLFDDKNHNYEIKRAEHNITSTQSMSQTEQPNYSSYDLDNVRIAPFSKEVAGEYYRTYYVFFNRFKLIQYLIFSLLLFVSNIVFYLLFNVVFEFNFDTAYYFVGGLVAILIALMASLAFFYKPNRRKKIYFDFKREILKKFYLYLILSAALVFILFIIDKNLFMNLIHFSKALIGIVLLLNVMSLPLIAQIMFKVHAFSVKA